MIKKRFNFFSKFSQPLIFLFLSLCALMLSINLRLSDSVLEGIMLWAVCILPSLLPYFFITEILSSMPITAKISGKLSPLMNKCFNQSGIVGYAYFMSLISGYPMGAKVVSDLRRDNLIGEAESVRASALCSTSSPMFLIASVGGIMFNSTAFGLLLLLCNFLSSITVGVIFSFYKRSIRPGKNVNFTPPKNPNLLTDSIYSAVNSSLFVGGIITLFFVFTEILVSLKLLSPISFIFSKIFSCTALGDGVAFGLFEYTKGLKTISASKISFFTLPVCAGLCGFGGLCVLVQSLLLLKNAKIKTAPFIFSKLLGAVLNFIFGLIFSLILL